MVCAVAASVNVSSCKINNTATRAKSSTWSVTAKVADGAVVLVVPVLDGADVIAALVEVFVVVEDVVDIVVDTGNDDVVVSLIVVCNMVEKEPVIVVGSVRVLKPTVKVGEAAAGFSIVIVRFRSGRMVTVIATAAAAACTTLESESPSDA